MSFKWINRANLLRFPYIGLCVEESAFRKAVLKLNPPEVPAWMANSRCGATTHFMRNADGELTCIVCIRPKKRTKDEIYGLLAHEAVHIVQEWFESIGETRPGLEFETYSVQGIFQLLMTTYEEIK